MADGAPSAAAAAIQIPRADLSLSVSFDANLALQITANVGHSRQRQALRSEHKERIESDYLLEHMQQELSLKYDG